MNFNCYNAEQVLFYIFDYAFIIFKLFSLIYGLKRIDELMTID